MTDKNEKNNYGNENIPQVDPPQNCTNASNQKDFDRVEPLPESTRPRKDGPGGE